MKRMLDLAVALPGLVLLSPLLLLVGVLIKLDDGGPVFFVQERIGQFGRTFPIWKFRTMVRGAGQLGSSLTVGNDPRITRIGWWLRRYKLDELPQLWNVVKGDMSLVGPRPELDHFVRLYSETQQAVLQLKPGITDPASIRFYRESELLGEASDPERLYCETIMPEKLRMNLQYARQATLRTDVMVLVHTVQRVFGRRNVA